MAFQPVMQPAQFNMGQAPTPQFNIPSGPIAINSAPSFVMPNPAQAQSFPAPVQSFSNPAPSFTVPSFGQPQMNGHASFPAPTQSFPAPTQSFPNPAQTQSFPAPVQSFPAPTTSAPSFSGPTFAAPQTTALDDFSKAMTPFWAQQLEKVVMAQLSASIKAQFGADIPADKLMAMLGVPRSAPAMPAGIFTPGFAAQAPAPKAAKAPRSNVSLQNDPSRQCIATTKAGQRCPTFAAVGWEFCNKCLNKKKVQEQIVAQGRQLPVGAISVQAKAPMQTFPGFGGAAAPPPFVGATPNFGAGMFKPPANFPQNMPFAQQQQPVSQQKLRPFGTEGKYFIDDANKLFLEQKGNVMYAIYAMDDPNSGSGRHMTPEEHQKAAALGYQLQGAPVAAQPVQQQAPVQQAQQQPVFQQQQQPVFQQQQQPQISFGAPNAHQQLPVQQQAPVQQQVQQQIPQPVFQQQQPQISFGAPNAQQQLPVQQQQPVPPPVTPTNLQAVSGLQNALQQAPTPVFVQQPTPVVTQPAQPAAPVQAPVAPAPVAPADAELTRLDGPTHKEGSEEIVGANPPKLEQTISAPAAAPVSQPSATPLMFSAPQPVATPILAPTPLVAQPIAAQAPVLTVPGTFNPVTQPSISTIPAPPVQ